MELLSSRKIKILKSIDNIELYIYDSFYKSNDIYDKINNINNSLVESNDEIKNNRMITFKSLTILIILVMLLISIILFYL